LFSLGVVLYTMLTGHRPFQGNSAVTISFKVVNRDPIPATLLDTELPPGLDYIISRAIAKDRGLRYQRGLEMVLDIQHLQQGLEPPSKAKQPLPTSNGDADQTEQELARSSALGYKAIRSNTRAVAATHDRPADFREHIRKTSLIGAVILAGLFVLGFWVISFNPRPFGRRIPPRVVSPSPLPSAASASPPLTPNPPVVALPTALPSASPTMSATSDANAASDAKSPKPIVQKSAKRVSSAAAPALESKIDDATLATPTPAVAVAPATLEIEVDHKFAEARLSIWSDDHLAYTHVLEGTDKKHLVMFHRILGHEIHAAQISPGKHSLRVQVSSSAANYDQSATVDGEFQSGQENLLRITFGKHGEINLSLQ